MQPNKNIDEIEAVIVEHIVKSTGLAVSEIDRTRRFDHYGLDSMDAVSMIGDLEDLVGRPLSAALPYHYPTVDALARRLHDGASE